MRLAANEASAACNSLIANAFGWDNESIVWVSPTAADEYSEYYDQEFLERLGLSGLNTQLSDFWPSSGPRWDGLARTESGKILLVEAKAYVEEAVDYRSGAGPASLEKIQRSLRAAKQAFGASEIASWEEPFYQYANRLAHLYFLRELNGIDAYLIFLNFANAPDVPAPATVEQWQGATRIIEKCLGLSEHPYRDCIKTVIWDVADLINHSGATK